MFILVRQTNCSLFLFRYGGFFCFVYTTSPSYVTRYVRRTYLLLLLLFGSLVDEVHELVELRRNDDLCAAVALFAHG